MHGSAASRPSSTIEAVARKLEAIRATGRGTAREQLVCP